MELELFCAHDFASGANSARCVSDSDCESEVGEVFSELSHQEFWTLYFLGKTNLVQYKARTFLANPPSADEMLHW